ncbi:MAG: response regulator, partial [Sphingobacteriales bacterium]
VYLCFQQQARLQDVRFDFVANGERILIYADREKIEIALFNLLFNAFKYTPAKGSITLLISETKSEVSIAIIDTGLGISKDIGDKLFNEFFQVPKKHNKAGFGIGLYLVRSFVEAHHGKVSYFSEQGTGSTFTIVLPKGSDHLKAYPIAEEQDPGSFLLENIAEVEIIADQPDTQIGRGEAQIEVFTEKPSVLLVDDNSEIRTYLKKIFQQEYVIYEADGGEAALELIQKYIPNIVISDILMGEVSGIDLCRKIKEDAALNHIPVVLLTSSTSAEIKLKGIECGADDFISKPFDKDILLARISNLIKNRNNLQRYFYNHITFKSENLKVSPDYKEFLEKCIRITEKRIDDPTFNIQELADEIGLSHSSLYKRVKSISGKSVSEFIRFIRLRKAAELLINSDYNVSECAFSCGFNDVKYFRTHFNKLYGVNPSEYILKYRKPFQKRAQMNRN